MNPAALPHPNYMGVHPGTGSYKKARMNCQRDINYHLATNDRVVSFGVTNHRIVYNSADELTDNR